MLLNSFLLYALRVVGKVTVCLKEKLFSYDNFLF